MRTSAEAKDELEGKTEMDALIAYLQELGTAVKRSRLTWTRRSAAS